MDERRTAGHTAIHPLDSWTEWTEYEEFVVLQGSYKLCTAFNLLTMMTTSLLYPSLVAAWQRYGDSLSYSIIGNQERSGIRQQGGDGDPSGIALQCPLEQSQQTCYNLNNIAFVCAFEQHDVCSMAQMNKSDHDAQSRSLLTRHPLDSLRDSESAWSSFEGMERDWQIRMLSWYISFITFCIGLIQMEREDAYGNVYGDVHSVLPNVQHACLRFEF